MSRQPRRRTRTSWSNTLRGVRGRRSARGTRSSVGRAVYDDCMVRYAKSAGRDWGSMARRRVLRSQQALCRAKARAASMR